MTTHPHPDDKRLLELLERWQSGDFSRADEQELQALADSDAFRRETVEGFWAMPEVNHAQHLATLRERLRQQNPTAKKIAFPRVLVAVAAALALVMAVVWLLPNQDTSAPVAQEKPVGVIDNQPIASHLPEEKSAPEARREAPVESDNISQTAVPGKNYPTRAATDPAASSRVLENAASAPGPEVLTETTAPKPSTVEGEYAQSDEVLDDVDTRPGNSAAAPAKESRDKMAKQATDAAKKKARSAPLAEPVGGWEKFQEYLRRNARLPEAARQQNVSGTVRVRFRLDEKNQPADIQTIRSLGYGCDEEAIRLIKAYPWQSGDNNDVTVDVPFIR